jgi:MSHA pilin protein MshD
MKQPRGVTLVELVIAVVVVGVAVSGLMTAYASMVGHSSDALIYQQSITLGDSFLAEITSKPFQDEDGNVCTSAPANRADYAKICDYNGYSSSNVTDVAGNSAGLNGYSVSVAVTAAAGELGALAAADVLRITVTINNPLGQSIAFTSYRANY